MQAIHKIHGAILILCTFVLSVVTAHALQLKSTVAILNIDTKGIIQDPKMVGNLVRLELGKTGAYIVFDNYEVSDALAKGHISIDSCFSKSCVLEIGRRLGAEKMLTGDVERLDEKIVITLRLIDVSSGSVEKSDVTEYQNLPEIQKMVRISVAKIAGLQPDPALASVLLDYDTPIANPNNSFTNNGPRVAVSYTLPGIVERRFEASEGIGGYNAPWYDVTMGWQQEFAYYSAGPFQAILEVVPAIGGFTYGMFIPSLTLLQGFRVGNWGLEFALGPNFRLMRMSQGYFSRYIPTVTINNKGVKDTSYTVDEGSWTRGAAPDPSLVSAELPDSRGGFELKTNLLLAAGITFHSGYLNLPLNVYLVPKKGGEGTTWGFSLGFNVANRKPKGE